MSFLCYYNIIVIVCVNGFVYVWVCELSITAISCSNFIRPKQFKVSQIANELCTKLCSFLHLEKEKLSSYTSLCIKSKQNDTLDIHLVTTPSR